MKIKRMKYFKYKYISLIVMDLGIPNQSEKRFERKLNTNRRIVLFFFYQIFAIFDDFSNIRNPSFGYPNFDSSLHIYFSPIDQLLSGYARWSGHGRYFGHWPLVANIGTFVGVLRMMTRQHDPLIHRDGFIGDRGRR